MSNIYDFDIKRLADYDPQRIGAQANRHRQTYDNHLAIAKWIDGWRERGEKRPDLIEREGGWEDGFSYALREVAAHLRQGDLLPDGKMIRNEFPDGYGQQADSGRWGSFTDIEIRVLFTALWAPGASTDGEEGNALRVQIQDEGDRRGISTDGRLEPS